MNGCIYTHVYAQWIVWLGNVMCLMAIKVTFHIDCFCVGYTAFSI